MGLYKSYLLFLPASFIIKKDFAKGGAAMQRDGKKKNYVMLCLLFFSLAVTLIDALVHPPYFPKIAVKIVFFLALPLLFFA